jgi:uncharacterized protein (TIGR03067 family)
MHLLLAACLLLSPSSPARGELPATTEIDRLIRQLGSEKFKAREAATKRLGELGEAAAGALREAAAHSDDAEIRGRAEGLLADLDRKDYAKLQGTWELVEVRSGRTATSVAGLGGMGLVADGERVEIWLSDAQQRFVCRLDPVRRPKAIDCLRVSEGRSFVVWRGIYALEGDRLRVCYTRRRRERPTEFNTSTDAWNTLCTFERVKKEK